MTNRFTTLAAAAALFIGLSGPAQAEDDVSLGTIGSWQLTAGTLYCDAKITYLFGQRMQFFIGLAGLGTSIGIFDKHWDIPIGSYEVVVQVDQTSPVTVTAKVGGHWVYIPIDLNDEIKIKALSSGQTLHVTIGHQIRHNELSRSGEVLDALRHCAAVRSAALANPFLGVPQAKSPSLRAIPETPSNPYRRM
jgi:hypothetical protein